MSKLSYCVVVALVLTVFAEDGLRAGDLGIIESEDLGELIVIDPMDQAGQERRGRLKPVVLRQLIAHEPIELIDVVGIPESDAVDAITAAGLRVAKITRDYSDEVAPGSVMKQEPYGGNVVSRGDEVNLVIAQTKIAIQPFELPGATKMELNIEEMPAGQLIVHRPFDVQLRTGIQNVPVFFVGYHGMHHIKGQQSLDMVEARAKCIAERLSAAMRLMDEGGSLEVVEGKVKSRDDWTDWHIAEAWRPQYAESPEPYPAIYARHKMLGGNRLRILTIYPEDCNYFGFPAAVDEQGNQLPASKFEPHELAEYLVNLIEAHQLLFSSKRVSSPREYDNLEICKTREGLIFKEIALRAHEVSDNPAQEHLRDALWREALTQRDRLVRLAYKAPVDWRVRDRY